LSAIAKGLVDALRPVHQLEHRSQSQAALSDQRGRFPNRALIVDRLEQMLLRARHSKTPVAALFIDLDNFKNVNDTLGHVLGDKLLCAASKRLKDLVRETDMIARLGGDEFAILQTGVEKAEHAASFAQRVIATINDWL